MSIHTIHGKRGDTYRVRFRDANGELQSRTFKRKGEAETFDAASRVEVRSGTFVAPSKGRTRYGDRAAHVQRSWSQLAVRTRKTYESLYRVHIEPRFGDRAIGSITRTDLQTFIDDLRDAGLADGTVIKAAGIAAAPLIDAHTEGLIARNPAHKLRLPPQVVEEADFLEPEELDALLDAIDVEYRALVAVQAYAGLRIGECAGLQWGDIDFGAELLYVRAGDDAARDPERPRRRRGRAQPRAKTKTAAGRRAVPLLPELAAELEAHRERLGATPMPSLPVFTMPGGGPLNVRNYRRRYFQPAAIACDLGERVRDERGRVVSEYQGIGTHTLRHTAATTWLDGGASAVEVAEWLGHTNARFSMQKYGHARPRHAATVMAEVQRSIEERRAAM